MKVSSLCPISYIVYFKFEKKRTKNILKIATDVKINIIFIEWSDFRIEKFKKKKNLKNVNHFLKYFQLFYLFILFSII